MSNILIEVKKKNKNFNLTLLFLIMLVLTFFAVNIFAQSVPVETNTSFLAALVKIVGSVSGMSTLAIVYAVSQLLMKFVGTPWFDDIELKGKWKLTIYTFLTMVGVLVGYMTTTEATIIEALTSGVGLAAIGVFLNQILKQFVTKKD